MFLIDRLRDLIEFFDRKFEDSKLKPAWETTMLLEKLGIDCERVYFDEF